MQPQSVDCLCNGQAPAYCSSSLLSALRYGTYGAGENNQMDCKWGDITEPMHYGDFESLYHGDMM